MPVKKHSDPQIFFSLQGTKIKPGGSHHARWTSPLDIFSSESESQQNPRIPGLVMTNSLLLKMAIEIVDVPIKNGDFP